jgi:hypothetical protein
VVAPPGRVGAAQVVWRDDRDAGALARGGEVTADVGPWAEQEPVGALAVGRGVLEEGHGEAYDRDATIGPSVLTPE